MKMSFHILRGCEKLLPALDAWRSGEFEARLPSHCTKDNYYS